MHIFSAARRILRKYWIARYLSLKLQTALGPIYVRWLGLYYAINRSASPPPAYYLNFLRTSSPVARPVLSWPFGRRYDPYSKVELKVCLDGSRDFSDYNEENFLSGDTRYENYDYRNGKVRKEDMGCAALYAFGIESFREAQKLFPETCFEDQVKAVLSNTARKPSHIAEIGCGLGSLTALLVACGVKIDAIDPGSAAQARLAETITTFTKAPLSTFEQQFRFFPTTLGGYMEAVQNYSPLPDTFIFVESIEHIPKEEVLAAVKVMRQIPNCLLIIANAVDFHPIWPDGTGWDHITLVDDNYYDEIAAQGNRTIVRAGSHLVVQF